MEGIPNAPRSTQQYPNQQQQMEMHAAEVPRTISVFTKHGPANWSTNNFRRNLWRGRATWSKSTMMKTLPHTDIKPVVRTT
eukprot:6192842-Pleurochrysis_carterae.AAC.1